MTNSAELANEDASSENTVVTDATIADAPSVHDEVAAQNMTVAEINLLLENLKRQILLDNNDDGIYDQWYELKNEVVIKLKVDRNYDGSVDYCAIFNMNQTKASEEYDYNYDGKMDDFYFYENGVLVRQEIDSNYDSKIDIWIYIYKGIYIEKYEQDTNYDGSIDDTIDYNS